MLPLKVTAIPSELTGIYFSLNELFFQLSILFSSDVSFATIRVSSFYLFSFELRKFLSAGKRAPIEFRTLGLSTHVFRFGSRLLLCDFI